MTFIIVTLSLRDTKQKDSRHNNIKHKDTLSIMTLSLRDTKHKDSRHNDIGHKRHYV